MTTDDLIGFATATLNLWHLKQAVRVLRAGGIVAYPTEAVYGLGCDPADAASVLALTALKRRVSGQGFIIIAADVSQVTPFIAMPSGPLGESVAASWPGHTTWVFAARPNVPRWLLGTGGTLAVRVTTHPVARSLCEEFGRPVVSTSANLRGAPPARSALDVRGKLPKNTVDYILCGKVGRHRLPSEIRDARDGRVLRKG